MTVKEAYELGLLRIGQRIKTNASCSELTDDRENFTGIIKYVVHTTRYTHIGVLRDDEETGSGPNRTWKINCNNGQATIEFELSQFTITVSEYITNRITKCVYNDRLIFLKFRKKIGNKKAFRIGKEYMINGKLENTILFEL